MMTILLNNYYAIMIGGIFSVIVIISLAELSYVVCVLERKLDSTERRLRSTEQNLQQYVMRLEALTRQLKDVKLELLSNQCDQLAKNRLMRRELRILLHKISNDVTENT